MPGTYCAVTESKREVPPRPKDGGGIPARGMNPFCQYELKARCDAIWKIRPGAPQRVSVTLHQSHGALDPCYSGPLPASTPR
jgi:hypothetical protein